MPRYHELPQVRPEWTPRHLSAAEVVSLVHGDSVPGVNPSDPVIRGLRRGLMGNDARLAFIQARQKGYLFVSQSLLREPDVVSQLKYVWSWWCTAAGHPHIVVGTAQTTDGVSVHCDVSTTGHEWSWEAFVAIGKLVEPLVGSSFGRWLFTTDELQLDDLEMDGAIHIARALVDLGTAGRFRPGVFDRGPEPRPGQTRFPGTHVPIERSAG